MPDLRSLPLACPVRDTGYSDTGASRRRPGESREPSERLGPGFHREPWIPAFAGMTPFLNPQFVVRVRVESFLQNQIPHSSAAGFFICVLKSKPLK